MVVAHAGDEAEAARAKADAVLREDAELVDTGVRRVFFVSAAWATAVGIAGVTAHIGRNGQNRCFFRDVTL